MLKQMSRRLKLSYEKHGNTYYIFETDEKDKYSHAKVIYKGDFKGFEKKRNERNKQKRISPSC